MYVRNLLFVRGQVIECQARHSDGVVDDCEWSPVSLETDVIVSHFFLLACVEHAQDTRVRGLAEQWE